MKPGARDYIANAFFQLRRFAMIYNVGFKLTFEEYVALCTSRCSVCGMKAGLRPDKMYHQVVQQVGFTEVTKESLRPLCARCYNKRLGLWITPEKLHTDIRTWDLAQFAMNKKERLLNGAVEVKTK